MEVGDLQPLHERSRLTRALTVADSVVGARIPGATRGVVVGCKWEETLPPGGGRRYWRNGYRDQSIPL
jgi:hypothetical protein